MAAKPTIWHPYNCQCVIEYMADPDVPNDPVVYSRHIRVCAAHAALPAGQERWNAAVAESNAQGMAMAVIQETLPDVSMVVTQDSVYVGPGRVIRISVIGATPTQLATLRAAVAGRVAAGRVVIV